MRCVQRRACPRPLNLNLLPPPTPLINYALPLAIWRGLVADRQASASQQQASEAQRQAETAQGVLLNERYQTGAEMLGNETLSVRLGGIYALQRLAEEYPHQYHLQVMRLFCAFVRNPTADEDYETSGSTCLY